MAKATAPDITYNPPDQPDLPYTTRSTAVARAVATSTASRLAYDRRVGEGDNTPLRTRFSKAVKAAKRVKKTP